MKKNISFIAITILKCIPTYLYAITFSLPAYSEHLKILVFYNNDARKYHNESPSKTISNMIERANTDYTKRNINVEFSLAGSIDIENDLDDFPSYSSVQDLRDSFNADLVSYLTGPYIALCKGAYTQFNSNLAYSLLAQDCISQPYDYEYNN